jgi:hypothetical protein
MVVNAGSIFAERAGRALGMIAGRSKQRQPLYSRHKG